MSTVAILGAGAGGCAAVAELTLDGHDVRLWSRRDETLAPIRAAGGVRYEGVLGDGLATPAMVSAEMAEVLDGADVALVCMPSLGIGTVAAELAAQHARLPVVLDPGGLAGALRVRAIFVERGVPLPPIAELATLTYVARKPSPERVRITNRNTAVSVACLPGGDAALLWAERLFPTVVPVDDVLAIGLGNLNMPLHAPCAVLGMAWVEATEGGFRFYSEGTTPGVARTILALDDERRAVARAFGHELPSLLEAMGGAGLLDPEAAARGDLGGAIRGGDANAQIQAPDSTTHRYYTEDIGYALQPFVELARVAGVDVPVAASLLRLTAVAAPAVCDDGLIGRDLGIEGLSVDELRRIVGS